MQSTSYEVSEALNAFLGDTAPKPLDDIFWSEKDSSGGHRRGSYAFITNMGEWSVKCFPAYTLEDLLSKPFCRAMAKKSKRVWHPDGISEMLWGYFYGGGFGGIERKLLRMINNLKTGG